MVKTALKAEADKPLTLADVDPDDDRQLDAWEAEEEKRAGERIHAAVRELKAKGVIDDQGNRIRKDLPPDMREDSDTDLTT
jgi:hypothetical protein